MQLAHGFGTSDNTLVCKLKKAIYGLKQAQGPSMRSCIMLYFSMGLHRANVTILFSSIKTKVLHFMPWSM